MPADRVTVPLDADTVGSVEPDGVAFIKAITPEHTVKIALGI